MVVFVRNKLVIHVVEVFCLPPARYSISTRVHTSYLRDIFTLAHKQLNYCK